MDSLYDTLTAILLLQIVEVLCVKQQISNVLSTTKHDVPGEPEEDETDTDVIESETESDDMASNRSIVVDNFEASHVVLFCHDFCPDTEKPFYQYSWEAARIHPKIEMYLVTQGIGRCAK